MTSPKGFEPCCLKSFDWNGTPSGHEATIANNPTYVTGSNPNAAVIIAHDALGWRFGNTRLLADHFAKEANVTVYIPDFFGGEVLDIGLLKAGKFDKLDVEGFKKRNSREVREPEIFACAKELRANGLRKLVQWATAGAAGPFSVSRLRSWSTVSSAPIRHCSPRRISMVSMYRSCSCSRNMIACSPRK